MQKPIALSNLAMANCAAAQRQAANEMWAACSPRSFKNNSNKRPFHETYMSENPMKCPIDAFKRSIIPIMGMICHEKLKMKPAANEANWRTVA